MGRLLAHLGQGIDWACATLVCSSVRTRFHRANVGEPPAAAFELPAGAANVKDAATGVVKHGSWQTAQMPCVKMVPTGAAMQT